MLWPARLAGPIPRPFARGCAPPSGRVAPPRRRRALGLIEERHVVRQAVADSPYAVDEFLVADREPFAQPGGVGVERPGLGAGAVAPDVAQPLSAGEHAGGVSKQREQQLVLLARELRNLDAGDVRPS